MQYFYTFGFILGYLLALVIKQSEIKYPSENVMYQICAEANSELEFYTEENIICNNGARFNKESL